MMPPFPHRLARWAPTAIGVALICAAGAMLGWQSWSRAPDDHRSARQFILYLTFGRVDDPIVVLGDSNTEAAILPATICGHPVVNAGLSGASTASDLGGWLTPTLDGKRPAMVIVSLGTNDALASSALNQNAFADRYRALLSQLGTLTSHLAVLDIPSIEQRERVTADLSDRTNRNIASYNAVLPEVARSRNAHFEPLPPMPVPHTRDGVHLNAAGHQTWVGAVAKAAATLCNG